MSEISKGSGDRKREILGIYAQKKLDSGKILYILRTFFFLRFYLFIHERNRGRQRHRQKEKQACCREPDVGLDPRAPGSRLEPKADAQPLSHPGVPEEIFFSTTII